MTEPNQPTAVLAMLIDAAGNAQIIFRRYHNTTGRQIMSETVHATGITETLRRLEEMLATAFTIPLKLSSEPRTTTRPNTRQLPCGCVISTTGTAPLQECERHRDARTSRDRDREERQSR